MFSDTESMLADEDAERPYTAPILADDEVAKDPSAHANQPAIEPHGFEIEEPTSRTPSRPASLYKEPSFELRSTPLEDVEEYEPLFNDDEKPEAKKPVKEEKPKKNKNHTHRFPSADVWEDAPSSVFYTAEVSTPELFDEQEKPSPAVVPPPREGETPAQAFARHQEELAEKETRERGPEGFIPARNTQKPLWAQHQKHLASEAAASRPIMQQRFPSRDVWEDTPDSLKLETTVSTPQQDEAPSPSPADIIKPAIPERPQSKSPAPGPAEKKPAIPGRPKPRQSSLDDKPAIPDRPKPQIPARPAKAGPTSGGLEPAEAAAPPPKQKPAVPARPMGSKIAALQAGFMSDLNRRLQLGPQAPKKEEEGEKKLVEEVKEKVPLSDARKGRARGPQRRAPAAVAAPVKMEAEEEKEKKAVVFGFASARTVFEIEPEEGRLNAGGLRAEPEVKVEVDSAGEEKEKEKESSEAEVEKVSSPPVVEEKEQEKEEGEDKGAVEAEKEEPEGVQEAKVEHKAEAEAESESDPEFQKDVTEAKSLVTNMAGETLVEEHIKKDEDHGAVEPVKVIEN